MPAPSPDPAFHSEFLRREARSELISCIIILAFITVAYICFLALVTPNTPRKLTLLISLEMLFHFLVFGSLIILLLRGQYRPWIRYVNSFAQVTIATLAVIADNASLGPVYAMASIPPMAYALPVAITAFRLRPSLSFFTGAVASLQFLLVYTFLIRPQLLADSAGFTGPLEALDWGPTIMKLIVILAVGVTSGIAAAGIRKTLARAIDESLRRAKTVRTFGRFISPQLAQALADDDTAAKPRTLDVVVMFADLRGFTPFSASRSPEQVAALLNTYFDTAARVIETHGGVLNKFLGDGFLAVFGLTPAYESKNTPADTASQTATTTADKTSGGDADNAVRAALELQKQIDPLLAPHNLTLTLGLHAGPVVAGEIGAEGRADLTVIGPTVNLASRIETLNRDLNSRCLLTKEVARRLKTPQNLTPRGPQPVKGLNDPVEVLELTL